MMSRHHLYREPRQFAFALAVAAAVSLLATVSAFPQQVDAAQAKPTRESLAASASGVRARLSGSGRDPATPAWRTDLAALVSEIERIAPTSVLPEKVELLDNDGKFRGASLLIDNLNQPLWIGKHDGPPWELHGALAAAFTGEFLWSGELKSVRVDPTTGDGTLELSISPRVTLPAGMAVVDVVTVSAPAAAAPATGFPQAGEKVTVTGVLKDGPDQGVWVAYGVGSNLGKTRILVNAEAYSVEEFSATARQAKEDALRDVLFSAVIPPGHMAVSGVILSPDGQTLVTFRSGPSVEDVGGMFVLPSNKPDSTLDKLELDGYGPVSYSPDGALAAVLSMRKSGRDEVSVYRLPQWSLQKTLNVWARGGLWWMPDGKQLLVSDRREAFVVSVETGGTQAKFRIEGFTSALSPDGRMMANAITGWGGRIELVPVDKPDARITFSAHKSWIKDLAFSPDSTILASAGADNIVNLWSVATGRLIRALEGHGNDVNGVRFESDGKTLVTASRDGTIRRWNVASGREIGRLTIPGSWITCLDLSANQSTLAIGEDSGTALILDYGKLKSRTEAELKKETPKR